MGCGDESTGVKRGDLSVVSGAKLIASYEGHMYSAQILLNSSTGDILASFDL